MSGAVLTPTWVILTPDGCDLSGHFSCSGTWRQLTQTGLIEIYFAAAVGLYVQDQVFISDKARHIPAGWNFIIGAFTTISCQPTMAGIPLITVLLQSLQPQTPRKPLFIWVSDIKDAYRKLSGRGLFLVKTEKFPLFNWQRGGTVLHLHTKNNSYYFKERVYSKILTFYVTNIEENKIHV